MKSSIFLLLVTLSAAVAILPGCSSTERVALSYSPSDRAMAAGSVRPMKVGRFEDRRGQGTYYLGSMRGGMGNPFKDLETDAPTASVIRRFFVDSLRRRSSYDPSSQYELSGTILRLEADQFVRGEVNIRWVLILTDTRRNRTIAIVPVNRDKMLGGVLNIPNAFLSTPEGFARKVSQVLSDATDRGVRDINRASP